MLITVSSSASSFLRALDENINKVPTMKQMVNPSQTRLYSHRRIHHENLMPSNIILNLFQDDLFDKDTEMALSNCLGDSTLLKSMVDPSIMKMICFQE